MKIPSIKKSKTLSFSSVLCATLLLLSLTSHAAVELLTVRQDANLNTTLVRIINQLDAILPLIHEGEAEQERSLPSLTRFQFKQFKTKDGVIHNGLQEDIMAIHQAIVNAINHTPLAPGHIEPLALDYTDIPGLIPHKEGQ
jgi:hypothetical protein